MSIICLVVNLEGLVSKSPPYNQRKKDYSQLYLLLDKFMAASRTFR